MAPRTFRAGNTTLKILNFDEVWYLTVKWRFNMWYGTKYISDAKKDKNGKSHLYSGGSKLALSVLYPIVLLGNLYYGTIFARKNFQGSADLKTNVVHLGNPMLVKQVP